VIAERVAAVRDRIARAAERARRSPEEVTLVGVSKTHPAEAVRSAFAAGIRDFGENRVQEAEAKVGALAGLREQGLRWHLIGHLQANKARRAVTLFDRIHSVDGIDLARRLDALVRDEGRVLPVLVQVDLAGEATKHGVPEDGLRPMLEVMAGLPALRVQGLMLIPPFAEEPERTRPYFRRLRELRDEMIAGGLLQGDDLSMGMSHDYEVAIEEGSTLVRVGTALFGDRA
jgi:pyridoxal phosphate enzyme (YggS family)